MRCDAQFVRGVRKRDRVKAERERSMHKKPTEWGAWPQIGMNKFSNIAAPGLMVFFCSVGWLLLSLLGAFFVFVCVGCISVAIMVIVLAH